MHRRRSLPLRIAIWIGRIALAVVAFALMFAAFVFPAATNVFAPTQPAVHTRESIKASAPAPAPSVSAVCGQARKTFSQPTKFVCTKAPAPTPRRINPTSADLCRALATKYPAYNESAAGFMGTTAHTQDYFDTGCHFAGESKSSLNLYYFPGTSQFGTDYWITRSDYDKVVLVLHGAIAPKFFFAAVNLPQHFYSLVVEWITPDQSGDMQLRIGWQGDLHSLSPQQMITAIDSALTNLHIFPHTVHPPTTRSSPGGRPDPVNLTDRQI